MRNTLVCVTNQYECERLIKAGKVLAEISQTNLRIVNINRINDVRNQDLAALEYLFSVSKENDGVMEILYDNNVMSSLSVYIKDKKCDNVITGIPENSESVIVKLWKKFDTVNFYVVDKNGALHKSDSFLQKQPVMK